MERFARLPVFIILVIMIRFFLIPALLIMIIPFVLNGKSIIPVMQITELRVNPAKKNSGISAGYFEVGNFSKEKETLVRIQADFAERVEIHETIHKNDTVKMVKLETIEIPSGKSVKFQPGGKHIMFFKILKDLKEGESVIVVFYFKSGQKLSVNAQVKRQ